MTAKVFADSDDTEVKAGTDAAAAVPAEAPPSALRAAGPKTGWVDNQNAKWTVLDTTARIVDSRPADQCARVHSVEINGIARNHRFMPDTELEMPKEHALKFLRLPEFRVYADGELVPRPLDIQDLLKPVDPAVLPVDQTVAMYSELTTDALLVRAKTLPGGENLSSRSGKEAIMAFLIDIREKAVAQRRIETGMGTLAAGAGEADFMSDAEARAMMRAA